MTKMTTENKKRKAILLDIDGTTIYQQIDQHFFEGITQRKADLRKDLVELLQSAQENFDIYILTARPEIVEPLLPLFGGTKSTNDIINSLENEGITIKGTIRQTIGGKGNAMAEFINNHQDIDKAILLDDQLKQIKSVKEVAVQQKLGNREMLAYDINSVKDMKKLHEDVGLEYKPPINSLEAHSELKDLHHKIEQSLFKITNGQDSTKIERTHENQEIYAVSKILSNLKKSLEDGVHYEYKPAINSVKKTFNGLSNILCKIEENQQITIEDISKASEAIFGKNDPLQVKVNSKIDRETKGLLNYVTRHYMFDNLKEKFEMYVDKHNDPIAKNILTNLSQETDETKQLCMLTDMLKNNPEIMNKSFLNTIKSILQDIVDILGLDKIPGFEKNTDQKLQDALKDTIKYVDEFLGKKSEKIDHKWENKIKENDHNTYVRANTI